MKMQGDEVAMSLSHAKDPTRFFAVVGAAYVPEHHAETHDRHGARPAAPPTEISLATSWAVLVTLIAAISIFAGEISVLASVGLTDRVMAAVFE
jgi:hypothetical protein